MCTALVLSVVTEALIVTVLCSAVSPGLKAERLKRQAAQESW